MHRKRVLLLVVMVIGLMALAFSIGCGESNQGASTSSAGGGASSGEGQSGEQGSSGGGSDTSSDDSGESGSTGEDQVAGSDDSSSEVVNVAELFSFGTFIEASLPVSSGISNAPEISNLVMNPESVNAGDSITISFNYMDYEMDAMAVILALTATSEGYFMYNVRNQSFGMFSGTITITEIVASVPSGIFLLQIMLLDQSGNVSNVLGETLTVY